MQKTAILLIICIITIFSNTAFCDNDKSNMLPSEEGLNSIPFVSLPSSQFLVIDGNSVEVQLEGTIYDDGLPLPSDTSSPGPEDPNKLTWWWEISAKPSEANEPVLISDDSNDISGFAYVYDDPNMIITVDPNVTLSKPGYYEFCLYASDGEKTNHATMGITLYPESQYDYREKGYLYFSPLPEAEYESAGTKYMLVRFVEISPNDVNNISSFMSVVGEKSGNHTGTIKIASDKKTVIFELDNNFSSNELVTVSLDPILEPETGTIEPYEYQFMTTGPMPSPRPSEALLEDDSITLSSVSQNSSLLAMDGPYIMPNGVSVPRNFPQINITTNDNPDSGYIFIDNRTSGGNSFNVIFDNDGNPVWYLQESDERRDMKVQKNGVLTMLTRNPMQFIGLDKHYRQIATYRAVNGASADEHELVVLEDGRYFLFGITNVTVDLSRHIPNRTGTANLSQTMIQGFTPEGDLIFQWKGLDHFKLTDADFEIGRFPHMNAIDFDDDGQLLLSSRHISEVTKINVDSGEIIWRLSGYNSDYTFVNDPLNGFRNQHSIRALGDRHYLLFDNGDLHNPSVSRSVEYELDPNDMTATVVWQYPDPTTTSYYSHYMGNTQRLPNGNTLINWAVGHLPKLTEVRPDGTKAFEMNWASGSEAYRTWRCQWDGMSLEPVLQVEQQGDSAVLLFNKFGDPNVDYYRIYGGKTIEPNTLWTVSDVTLATISDFPSSGYYYFRVTAVDVNGTESGFSNEEMVYITNPQQQGENIVVNGDFSDEIANWLWETVAPASAEYEIVNGVFHFKNYNAGNYVASIQLRQKGLLLYQGHRYKFEFDAWADSPTYIEAKVGQEVSPWTNYSRIGYSSIGTESKHFTYTFDMNNSTDSNSRVVFNTGTSDIDVYIDNVSLKQISGN